VGVNRRDACGGRHGDQSGERAGGDWYSGWVPATGLAGYADFGRCWTLFGIRWQMPGFVANVRH
jgi:hypothetical protein